LEVLDMDCANPACPNILLERAGSNQNIVITRLSKHFAWIHNNLSVSLKSNAVDVIS
jgi:hypothetical protein